LIRPPDRRRFIIFGDIKNFAASGEVGISARVGQKTEVSDSVAVAGQDVP